MQHQNLKPLKCLTGLSIVMLEAKNTHLLMGCPSAIKLQGVYCIEENRSCCKYHEGIHFGVENSIDRAPEVWG